MSGVEGGFFDEVVRLRRRSNVSAIFTEQSSMILLNCQWVLSGIHSNHEGQERSNGLGGGVDSVST